MSCRGREWAAGSPTHVSRLLLDPATLAVTGGSYAITGTTAGCLFQHLCSGTFVGSTEEFGREWFLTGEEAITGGAEGIQLGVKHDGSEVRELPRLGRFAHEYYIAIPGLRFRPRARSTGSSSTPEPRPTTSR